MTLNCHSTHQIDHNQLIVIKYFFSRMIISVFKIYIIFKF